MSSSMKSHYLHGKHEVPPSENVQICKWPYFYRYLSSNDETSDIIRDWQKLCLLWDADFTFSFQMGFAK